MMLMKQSLQVRCPYVLLAVLGKAVPQPAVGATQLLPIPTGASKKHHVEKKGNGVIGSPGGWMPNSWLFGGLMSVLPGNFTVRSAAG
jgi:hypothetical protein